MTITSNGHRIPTPSVAPGVPSEVSDKYLKTDLMIYTSRKTPPTSNNVLLLILLLKINTQAITGSTISSQNSSVKFTGKFAVPDKANILENNIISPIPWKIIFANKFKKLISKIPFLSVLNHTPNKTNPTAIEIKNKFWITDESTSERAKYPNPKKAEKAASHKK